MLDFQREASISLDRLDRLDSLAFLPGAVEVELPDTMIRTALGAGMAVAPPDWSSGNRRA